MIMDINMKQQLMWNQNINTLWIVNIRLSTELNPQFNTILKSEDILENDGIQLLDVEFLIFISVIL